jgi:hypothetical protein
MNKATITAPAATTAGKATWVTALKAGLFLLVMIRLSAGVYGFFWGTFSLPALDALLGTWRVADYAPAVSAVLELSFLPLTAALIFVLAPLVGWWIYSRIEPAQQSAVGWSTVGFYLLIDGLLGVLTGQYGFLFMLTGMIVVGLYTMFWMGIGYNLAKLFRIKL